MVNTPHPSYNENLLKWQRCRHVLAGEDAVKAAGVLYLPKLDGQDAKAYGAYKMRASFFNATSRTVDSFVGMIFRKEPTEKIPAAIEAFTADATLHGQSWYDYQKFVAREVIGIGRSGTLIDWSEEEGRPYACNYTAEQILNWKTSRINGRTMVSMVVLQEEIDEAEAAKMLATGKAAATSDSASAEKPAPKAAYDVRSKTGPAQKQVDEYGENKVKQIRVLRLTAPESGTGDPVYTVEIWQLQKEKDEYQLMLTLTPSRKGATIKEIPFVFHGPNNLLTLIDRPPIEDIVLVNLSHYRSSADLEHGRHFTGLPTAFAAGFDTNKEYKIGSAVAWVATDPQASAGYLEFTGQGLGALDKALEQKERQMAVLGARMLEQEKKGVETEAVLSMKQTGEQSSLAQIACTASESFELILRWALWWSGAADSDFKATATQVECELNTDFNPAGMPPQLITAIISAVQSGLLSRDSAITAFKRGELVSEVRTVQEELDLIETELPALDKRAKDLSSKGDPKPGEKGEKK